ncbi:hypothetical protein M5K25_018740 [Dendrobium thyrsiflorum]|uniref:DUF4283 domain-containing protein n=1 Tax=Dendrobium thyrsiflorum TaxID=117978 RepID=A0ABD0UJD9_DENTH
MDSCSSNDPSRIVEQNDGDVLIEVGSANNGNSCINISSSSVNALPAILVSDDDIPLMEEIRSFFHSLKHFSSFSVSLLDARHVFINLSNDLDYTRIFRRSYYVRNCQMRLLKWSPNFDINSKFPICPVDQATANKFRPYVARILVEMDITKEFPNEIWIGSEKNGYTQKIEFENFPIFCTHFKLHGHDFQGKSDFDKEEKIHFNLKNGICRIHGIEFFVIIEPLINVNKLSYIAWQLGFHNSFSNLSNKMWFFCSKNAIVHVLDNFSQWIGGCAPNIHSMDDFSNVILDCKLTDIGFVNLKYTWNNNRLWQMLDRVLFNHEWIAQRFNTSVEHLSRSLSDHCPLFVSINLDTCRHLATFMFHFQNMWIQNLDFDCLVNSNWSSCLAPDNSIKGMVWFWLKLKRLKQCINWWNKHHFKNLFANIKRWRLRFIFWKKILLMIRLVIEETYWRQKAFAKHLFDGDKNTKYFHALVSKKNALNSINKVKDGNGNWIKGKVNVLPLVNPHVIENAISLEDNFFLTVKPSDNEIYLAVMSMTPSSTAGPVIKLLFNHVKKIKDFLDLFSSESGLYFNVDKFSLFTFKWITRSNINRISPYTKFSHHKLSFKYLGVPIFKGLKKSHLFYDIFQKNCGTISSWEFHFLSLGGGLLSLRSTWDNICGPLNEGGLGYKTILDSITASSFKLWWNFRKNQSLWAKFMNFKYCKGKHPLCCFYKHGYSFIWKRLCDIRHRVEPLIIWGLNSAN